MEGEREGKSLTFKMQIRQTGCISGAKLNVFKADKLHWCLTHEMNFMYIQVTEDLTARGDLSEEKIFLKCLIIQLNSCIYLSNLVCPVLVVEHIFKS